MAKENEPMGAFEQMDASARVPSKLGAIASNFYGTDPSLGQSMGDVVRELMPTQADKERSSSMAFWGGFGAPNNSGSLSGQLGNATKAQSDRELEGEKLKASYVPMITQAMLANQTQTLAASKAAFEQATAASGPINNAIAASTANGGTPTVKDLHGIVDNMGAKLGLSRFQLKAYHEGLPTDDKDVGAHVGRLQQQINPTGLANTVTRDPSGKLIITNAGAGSIAEPNAKATGLPADKSVNPTTGEANFTANAMGDPKAFSEQLQGQAEAATSLVKDLNEIHKNVSNFTPGKFAEKAGQLAASVKDLGGRIPGVDKAQLEKLSGVLLNSPEGSKDSLAALQMTDQLLSMNAMRTARDAAGGRASIPEFNAAHMAALASASDPATFAKLDAFARNNAERAVGRLGKFNEHLNNPEVKDKSILSFETKYHRDMLDDLNKQDKANTAERKVATDKATPAEVKVAAPVAKAAPAGKAVDLSLHEKGAEANSKGQPMVFENGRYRPAKLLKP